MATIYAATKPVAYGLLAGYDHLYLVYDPDTSSDVRNRNEEIIRGGPSTIVPTRLDVDIGFFREAYSFGDLRIESGLDIVFSSDDYGFFDPFLSRRYTELDTSGLNASNVWSYMTAHAEAIASADLSYILLADFFLGLGDGLVYAAINSNSVFSSTVSSAFGEGNADEYLPDYAFGDWPGFENDLSTWVDVPRDGYDVDVAGGIQRYKLGTDDDDVLRGESRRENYVLDGGDGEDTITGNRGNDEIYGGPGQDILRGNGGRDSFVGYLDHLDGDKIKDFDDNDRIEVIFENSSTIIDAHFDGDLLEIFELGHGSGKAILDLDLSSGYEPIVNIIPGRGIVRLQPINAPEEDPIDPDDRRDQPTRIGTASSDVLQGDNSDDVIAAHAGNDVINGSEGSDVAYGNGDHDIIRAGTKTAGGVDSLYGGTGSDTLYGSDGPDNLYGQWDLDTHLNAGSWAVDDDKNDRIEAGGGDDIAYGGNGADEIHGGSGDDFLAGLASNDGIYGDAGDDLIYGNSGHDNAEGGDGNDTMYGGSGTDIMLGGAGDDKLIAYLDLETFALAGFDNGHDAENFDWLFGGDGNDTIIGGAGSDDLKGSNGNDLMYGLWGDDAAVQGGSGDDSLYGNGGSDTLEGGAGDDFLMGGSDDDVLWGGTGDDTLEAMHGTDNLHGEAGADSFVLYGGDFGSHFVEDFSAAEGDKIKIDSRVDDVRTALGADGIEIYDASSNKLMLTLKGVFAINDDDFVGLSS